MDPNKRSHYRSSIVKASLRKMRSWRPKYSRWVLAALGLATGTRTLRLSPQDLLRSPQYGRQSLALVPDDPPPLAPFTSVPIEEEEDQLNASNTPWHGAMALQNSGQERSSVVGTWDSFGAQDNGLEFTPEAIALADYFNKGGVGGISALDLGFSVTPSLYPDHLFEPQFIHDEHNHKFFLPSQKFCIGCASLHPPRATLADRGSNADLYPWHVPPLKTLSRFASHAATSFLPSVPIVHPSTMVLSEMTSHTAFALTVTGAAYEKEGEGFSNEMLVEKRVFLVRCVEQGARRRSFANGLL